MNDHSAASSFDRRDTVILFGLVAAAIIARVVPGVRSIDDSFITFRYARNLAEGMGFVYNPGEQVLGTTTPLFASLMAFIGLVTGQGDYPSFALTVNALADAATCALLYLLGRRLLASRVPAVVLGTLWALAPMSVTFTVGGMETGVFILFMVLTFWLYIEGYGRWVGLVAALGVLTRPDALIWAGLVFLHQLWARFRERDDSPLVDWVPWRTWAVFIGVLLPWVLFSLAYFGSPVPRSVGAKSLTYTLGPGATLVRLIQHFATPFFEFDALGTPGIAIGSVLYPVLFGVGALRVVRGSEGGGRALPAFVYPWVYATIFAIANLLIFRWYLAPPLPVYFLGIVAGGWVVAGGAAALLRDEVRYGLFGALVIVWLVFSLNAWELHPDHGPDRPAPEMAFIKLELLYKQAAEMLVGDYGVTPETVVAAGDIGALGYHSRAVIFDTIGLVTPEASVYYPVDPALLAPGNPYAIPAPLILDAKPDFLVIVESYGRLSLMQSSDFLAQYELVALLETGIYDSYGMQIFRRRD